MEAATMEMPIEIGRPVEGGFFAGCIRVRQEFFVVIAAPKFDGEHDDGPWNKSLKAVEGAGSYCDGMSNTRAMAEAGSKLATWALDLLLAGHDDWYLPSRDELELLYRAFKPGTDGNYGYRSGDNPSSIPAGYPYTKSAPARCAIEAFQSGGAEAFEETWYWSSTQSASVPDYAWCQDFDGGGQDGLHKTSKLRARAVRRLKFSPSSI